MKQILISILMILVFSCGGGGSSTPPVPTNCEQCVYNSIIEFWDGGICDASDLNASGCINMIELYSYTPSTTVILYNTNFNITGYQFDIENMENITSLSNSYNMTVSYSNLSSLDGSRILGYSMTGETIPAGCSILLTIMHDSNENESFQISNITFTDDTVNEDLSPNIIDVCPL